MSKLPYLNLGCGGHFHKDWVNVDFGRSGEGVIPYNLLKGIPFEDNYFEVVYHSHVLEHFSKNDGVKFLTECYRVLKPGGILRIAVPDLEQIVKQYQDLLIKGKSDPQNEQLRADYNWMMIEMYDQTVRNTGGGEMLAYLADKNMPNEPFMIERIGYEGAMLRKALLSPAGNVHNKRPTIRRALSAVRSLILPRNIREHFLKMFFKEEYETLQLGRFRLSGEVHQWMYDIYSLSNILNKIGFKSVHQTSFDESEIKDWRGYGLDEVDQLVRKPDSLFVEAFK